MAAVDSLRAIYYKLSTWNFNTRFSFGQFNTRFLFGLLDTLSDEDIDNRFILGASAIIIAFSIIYYFCFSYNWISAEKRLLGDLKVVNFNFFVFILFYNKSYSYLHVWKKKRCIKDIETLLETTNCNPLLLRLAWLKLSTYLSHMGFLYITIFVGLMLWRLTAMQFARNGLIVAVLMAVFVLIMS